MIIVEGSDHTGKTTFCKKLEQHPRLQALGMTYQALSRLPDKFHRYWGYERLAQAVNTIRDRFHMSEVAYAYARGDASTTLCPTRYRFVDGMLRTRCAFTVVITCDPDELLARLRKSPKDEMYPVDKIIAANGCFMQLAQNRCFAYGSNFYDDVDVDAHLRCDERRPFPSDADVSNVIDAYERRRYAWENVMHDGGVKWL